MSGMCSKHKAYVPDCRLCASSAGGTEPMRELDRQVAEARGGPTRFPQHYWWHGSTPSLDVDDPVYAGPAYSTDIAAAWELVEEMRLADRELDLFGGLNGYQLRLEHVGWWNAATAPEAICHAYLAWKAGPRVVDSSEGPYFLDSTFAEFRPSSSR